MTTHTRRFIISSLLYFIAGCLLGVVSTAYPDLIPLVRPIHVHVNLLGWVSMMIMGVSYFVIPVFIRKSPFSDRAVTLHLVLANVGILGMVASFAAENYSFLAFFAVIEVLASYIFLFNIVSTAVKGRPVEEMPDEWSFLLSESDREVDRWASYFTQASTVYFVIGCTLGGYMALSPSGWSYLRVHFHLNLLGWVTMMIYGVAYHIFPRFSGRPVRAASLVKTNFIIANAGLLLMAAAMIMAEKMDGGALPGHIVMVAGVIEGIAGVIFVYNILQSVAASSDRMGKAAVAFVMASLSYLLFGIILGLIMAVNPESAGKLMPVHAHLNALGWITMMIFGVGCYIIPAFAGRKLYSQAIAGIQFWVANTGLIGFVLLLPYRDEGMGLPAALFASLEFLAALMFAYNIARSIKRAKR